MCTHIFCNYTLKVWFIGSEFFKNYTIAYLAIHSENVSILSERKMESSFGLHRRILFSNKVESWAYLENNIGLWYKKLDWLSLLFSSACFCGEKSGLGILIMQPAEQK